MRRSIPSINILAAAFVVSVLATAVLFFWYEHTLVNLANLQRESRRLQNDVAAANRVRLVSQALLKDAIEYAHGNPSLNEILKGHSPLMQDLGFLSKPTSNPAAKPASR